MEKKQHKTREAEGSVTTGSDKVTDFRGDFAADLIVHPVSVHTHVHFAQLPLLHRMPLGQQKVEVGGNDEDSRKIQSKDSTQKSSQKQKRYLAVRWQTELKRFPLPEIPDDFELVSAELEFLNLGFLFRSPPAPPADPQQPVQIVHVVGLV